MQVSSLNSGWNPQQVPVSTSSIKVDTNSSSNQYAMEISEGLSPLASFALSHQVYDLSVSAEQTQFVLRSSDNSVAMRVHSTTDIQASVERMTLDIQFSAEALGLTAKHFEGTKGKPIQFSLSLQRESLYMSYEQNISIEKTIRSADEILTDITKGITEVLRKPGDKGIALVLDSEAVQSLLGASGKSGELLDEIIQLLVWINTMKLGKGNKELYAVEISGKGKPIINVDEKTKVNIQALQLNVNITINPPTETAATAVLTDAQSNQTNTVNVSA